jgi:putative ABC transport system permease protein
MFDVDKWNEILETLSKNKLRTFLTGFAVFWGIFMLVILLGAGNGLKNGIVKEFNDDAINSIWIWGGVTNLEYEGLKVGREIQLKNSDFENISNMNGADHGTSRYNVWGATANYGAEGGSFNVRSVHPDHQILENTLIIKGRYINESDLLEFRKVAVIGVGVVDQVYKDIEPIGSYLNINGIPFKIVGIFKDEGSEREEQYIYLPITTGQRVFAGQDHVNNIMVTTGDLNLEQSDKLTDDIKLKLAKSHHFDPADQRAVYVRNNNEEFQNIMNIIRGIKAFILVIASGTIVAGVVGVGNIMTIVIKERTKEIGIRKALGATPNSIISLVLQESIFVTSFAGYFGLIAGIALLELLGPNIDSAFFVNPEVDVNIALGTTLLLVFAGALAGFFPALRAARIKPIVALRDE